MKLRFLFLFLGIFLMTIGMISILAYLNLLTITYNFLDYIHFISRDFFCWCFPIGILFLLPYILGGKK